MLDRFEFDVCFFLYSYSTAVKLSVTVNVVVHFIFSYNAEKVSFKCRMLRVLYLSVCVEPTRHSGVSCEGWPTFKKCFYCICCCRLCSTPLFV